MSNLPMIWWVAPGAALSALFVATLMFCRMLKGSEGTDLMIKISGFIKEGAMVYLGRQYRVIAFVFAVVFAILVALAWTGVQAPFVPFVFLSGGLWSAVCGYLGMKTATNASARTAHACRSSLSAGLSVAFRGGAVMGLLVVGFGLLDLSLWFLVLNYFYDHNVLNVGMSLMGKLNSAVWDPQLIGTAAYTKVKWVAMSSCMLTYAMGASVMALFARVGGGIFTKAADVGADLVGKMEAGIPEDDPRNPATIADNVGDNVGDVAGMGADLYESYCGSILAATALGASLVLKRADMSMMTVFAPMVVAGGGILFSLLGIFFVRTKEGANQKQLLHSLLVGTGVTTVLTIAFVASLAYLGMISWGVVGAVVTGLLAGVLIGQVTEYYTSDTYRPTQKIAEACQKGAATTILGGMAVGMISSGIPVFIIVLAIMLSFGFTGGFLDLSQGIYGIAFAAIGMLSTLGIQLATDAFGPIADNAGGCAQMAGLPEEVRERTDALDSLGNTTAATGKGFAIGSAALTALALIAAYLDSIKQWLAQIAGASIHYVGDLGFSNMISSHNLKEKIFSISQLGIHDLVYIFQINIVNPKFLCGLFLGSAITFVFCSLTISAVGRAATAMVNEVRRQFKEIKGILTGDADPDYKRCVDIATTGALRAMVLPSILAITVPIAVGMILNVAGVLGLLTGALTTGFCLAIMLNNAGGAWDNAKKYIEVGHYGGKGSDSHMASVIGDTVGDPFKDTSGPSLNILIKLMTIVSIVFVGLILKYGLYF